MKKQMEKSTKFKTPKTMRIHAARMMNDSLFSTFFFFSFLNFITLMRMRFSRRNKINSDENVQIGLCCNRRFGGLIDVGASRLHQHCSAAALSVMSIWKKQNPSFSKRLYSKMEHQNLRRVHIV